MAVFVLRFSSFSKLEVGNPRPAELERREGVHLVLHPNSKHSQSEQSHFEEFEAIKPPVPANQIEISPRNYLQFDYLAK